MDSELAELQREIIDLRQQLASRSQPVVSSSFDDPEEYEVVICSAPWCGSCQVYENSGKITKIKSKYKVSKVNTDNRQDWARLAPRIPAVFLLRSSDRVPVQTWEGAVNLETIEAKVKSLRNGRKTVEKTKTTTQSAGYAASSCNCSSACSCGCQLGGECSCQSSQPFQQQFHAPQQTQGVMYGGAVYTGRVCSNPNCKMCNQIQRGLQRQQTQYQPMSIKVEPAQEGTPHESIGPMLDAMQLTRQDIHGDIGCGDGRICIAVAHRGIRSIGIEIDAVKADEARRNVRAAGLEHLVTIETGDARDFDESRVTAITAYLYPELLDELAPKMKSVRVAASVFHEVDGFTQVGDVWIHRRADAVARAE